MFCVKFSIIFIITCFIAGSENKSEMTSDIIPRSLVECYRGNITILPMTITTLIEIIRKVELNPYFSMDMRMLSNSILHRFWRDGIERDPNVGDDVPGVVPYRPSGFQSHKYKILIEKLIPGSEQFFPNETLSLDEQCTLHFMLSSSVEAWERGDEGEVCPEQKTQQRQKDYFESTGVKRSTCPIEKGVIKAGPYGTISPSHVISAVATTLAPMQVKQAYLSDKLRNSGERYVDNKWAATLAGELAELVVIQAPLTKNLYLGPEGKWNDTVIPTEYYMEADYEVVANGFWQCTNAELLGSVDGLIIAQEAEKWISLLHTLRLSQLLEIYYTNQGSDFSAKNRACNRRGYFLDHLMNQEQTLTQQTQYFAEVLALDTPHFFLKDDYITDQSQRLFGIFKNYMLPLLAYSTQCPEKLSPIPKLNVNLIFDSTWTPYEREKFIMSICDDVDVSVYGSRISIISGKSGDYVVLKANSSVDVYLQWKNATNAAKDPVGLELAPSLLSIKKMIEANDTHEERVRHSSGEVTIVLALSSSLSDFDLNNSMSALKGIKSQCPEMQFFYVTTNTFRASYDRLTSFVGSLTDQVLSVNNVEQNDLRKRMREYLYHAPRTLRAVPCATQKRVVTDIVYEEYISPGRPYYYKIHQNYLCDSSDTVSIKFQNEAYGNLIICLSREGFDNKTNCQEASLLQDVEFNITKPCIYNSKDETSQWKLKCKPVLINVVGKRSLSKCTEKDCRLPDQLRFTIIIQGLRCIKDKYVTCSATVPQVFSIVNFLVLLFFSLIASQY